MLYPFPSIADVFIDNLENNGLVFFPLCSIDLGNSQKFHIVSPWSIGGDDYFFDDKASHYLMKFKFNNNKYQFNDDYQKFSHFNELKTWQQDALAEFAANKKDYLFPKSFDEYYHGEKKKRDDLRYQQNSNHAFYHNIIISYLITKENFNNTEKLVAANYFTDGYIYDEQNLLNRFGGQPEWMQEIGEIQSTSGTPLIFIAQLTGSSYHNNAPDEIYLFYDQQAQEVVQVFQWT